ncbi:MAG: LysM peptidoglycan-binding domain-containing protein [Kiritimatiellae bacterium]|nr:LysM peptidoglycan-binding domain-containing protein [Kiritimatiellia bacterium]
MRRLLFLSFVAGTAVCCACGQEPHQSGRWESIADEPWLPTLAMISRLEMKAPVQVDGDLGLTPPARPVLAQARPEEKAPPAPPAGQVEAPTPPAAPASPPVSPVPPAAVPPDMKQEPSTPTPLPAPELLEPTPEPLPSLRSNPELLKQLQTAVQAHEADQEKILRRDKKIAQLEKELGEQQTLTATLKQDLAKTAEQIRLLEEDKQNLADKIEGLRNTLHEYRLGRFEFYEVQAGDTLNTIAADPLVYGDATKAELIRQANRRRVKDIDSLRPGEILIIPRFPPSGKYDW